MEIKPGVQLSNMINTDDLLDITDKLQLMAYIHTDPDNGSRMIHIRVRNGSKFDFAVDLGGLGDKALESFDLDGNLI